MPYQTPTTYIAKIGVIVPTEAAEDRIKLYVSSRMLGEPMCGSLCTVCHMCAQYLISMRSAYVSVVGIENG